LTITRDGYNIEPRTPRGTGKMTEKTVTIKVAIEQRGATSLKELVRTLKNLRSQVDAAAKAVSEAITVLEVKDRTKLIRKASSKRRQCS